MTFYGTIGFFYTFHGVVLVTVRSATVCGDYFRLLGEGITMSAMQ